MTPAISSQRLRLGIMCLAAATFVFSCLDAFTKIYANTYPIEFTLMIRFWVFAAMTLVVAARSPGGIRQAIQPRRPWLQALRGTLLFIEIAAVAESFKTMGMADMQAIIQLYPLIIMVMAVFILHERIGWQQWVATALGFGGLLIIVRPGFAAFPVGALWVLVSAVFYALYLVLTRLASATDTPATNFLSVGIVGMILSTLVGIPHITPIAPQDWLGIAGLCLTGVGGHFLIIKALQYAPAGVLQPFNYLQLIWSTLMGYLVFGAIPDGWTLVGGGIIGLSGLYALSLTPKD